MVKKIICALVCSLGSATLVQAGMITDVVDQKVLLKKGQAHTYTHDFTEEWDEEFTLGTAKWGWLDITFYDDQRRDGWEIARVYVEDDYAGTSFRGSDVFEWLLPWGDAIGSLNKYGHFDVTVHAKWGDVYLGDSIAKIKTGRKPKSTVSVPEPGVAGLLAIGLLGLGVARARA